MDTDKQKIVERIRRILEKKEAENKALQKLIQAIRDPDENTGLKTKAGKNKEY
jgi:hypothetical protein